MADAWVRLCCRLYGLIHRGEFSASRPLEGNAAYMGHDEKYWWGYKFYCSPIEKAEVGSGLEEFFRDQNLDFGRDDFVETAGMTLCAGGDILVSPQLRPETTRSLWDDVRGFYFRADLVYANLETPIAPSSPPGFLPASVLEAPALNGTPEMFDRIVEGGKGINFFSTANNHCLDQGEAGLRETLDFLDAAGYPHVGTSRSPEERDAVVMVERGGLNVAFISFTFALNWKELPEGKEYLANYVRLNRPDADISPIAAQVKAARAAGADAVVALLHWSLEFESYPASNIVAMGHRLIELGVDVIVGNHPHGVQPIERHSYVDRAPGSGAGRRREGLIIYALGDLVSYRRKDVPNSRLGNLARIRISKGKAGGEVLTQVSSLEVLPTYLYSRDEGGSCRDFRVLDFRGLLSELQAGTNRFGLSRTRLKELWRLEALMNKVLGAALKRTPGNLIGS
jgi:poly-gamma-glutamate capsule biosynthesis protein CapA/YwtB (metallophosphatase superfamily)